MSHKLRDISNPNKDPHTASSKVNDIEPLRPKDTSSSLPAYAVTDTEGERSADFFGMEFRPITAYETLHLRSAESFDLSEIGSEDKVRTAPCFPSQTQNDCQERKGYRVC